jgi:hypothetical protein
MQSSQGVMHFRVRGKRGKIRFVPVHAMAQRLIDSHYFAFYFLVYRAVYFGGGCEEANRMIK